MSTGPVTVPIRMSAHELMFPTNISDGDVVRSPYLPDFELDRCAFADDPYLFERIHDTDLRPKITKLTTPCLGASTHTSTAKGFFEEEEDFLASESSVGDYASDNASYSDLSDDMDPGFEDEDTNHGQRFRIESAWQTSMTAHPFPACRLAFAVSLELVGPPQLVDIVTDHYRSRPIRQQDIDAQGLRKERSFYKSCHTVPLKQNLGGSVDTCDTNGPTTVTSLSIMKRSRYRLHLRGPRSEGHRMSSTSSFSAPSDASLSSKSSSSRHSYVSTTPSSTPSTPSRESCTHENPLEIGAFEKFKQTLRSAEGRRIWGELLDDCMDQSDDARETSSSDNLSCTTTDYPYSCTESPLTQLSKVPNGNSTCVSETFRTSERSEASSSRVLARKHIQSLPFPMQSYDLSWIHEERPQKLTYAAYDPYGSAPPTLGRTDARKPRSFQTHEGLVSLFSVFPDRNPRSQSLHSHAESGSFVHNIDLTLGDLVA